MKTSTILHLVQFLTVAAALRIDIVDTVDLRRRDGHHFAKIYSHTDEELNNMVGDHVVEQSPPDHGINLQLELPTDGRNFVNEPLEQAMYLARIELNGKELVVALDPTSPDFWVDADLGDVQNLHAPLRLDYEKNKHYHVAGFVSAADLTIGTYTLEKQAFLHASSVTMGDYSKMHINGVLGLDLPLNTTSRVYNALQSVRADGKYDPEMVGERSFLKNILRQADSDHQFYAIALSDPADPESPSVLSIGEHPVEGIEEVMKDVHKSPLPLAKQMKWSAPVKDVMIGSHELKMQGGKTEHHHGRKELVAWIDPATKNIKLPSYMVDELYKHVPGAVKLVLEHGGVPHPNGEIWSVPCNTKALFSLQVGGTRIPISPLQLSDLETATLEDGQTFASCISSIVGIPSNAPSNKEYDIILGAGFFRNAYTVFGVEDENGEPYMQFKALHTDEEAVEYVESIRMKQVKEMGGEYHEGSSSTKSRSSHHGKAGSADAFSLDDATSDNAESDFSLSSSTDTTLEKLAIGGLGILGLNVLLGLVILAGAVLVYVKKGGNSSAGAATVRTTPHYIPVRFSRMEETGSSKDKESMASDLGGYQDEERGYGNSGV